MKNIFAGILLSILAFSSAEASTLVCTLVESGKATNYSSVTADLSKPIEEVYIDHKGVDIGENNYSFSLLLDLNETMLEITALFTENNNVQDEVASDSWIVDLSQVASGTPVVLEDLKDTAGRKLMDFVCVYRK